MALVLAFCSLFLMVPGGWTAGAADGTPSPPPESRPSQPTQPPAESPPPNIDPGIVKPPETVPQPESVVPPPVVDPKMAVNPEELPSQGGSQDQPPPHQPVPPELPR